MIDQRISKELDKAQLYNKYGYTKLYPPTEDPSQVTLRTYEGKVFQIADTDNLEDMEKVLQLRNAVDKKG